MILNNPESLILFEHRFWLQILGDHSRFILSATPTKEMDKAKKAMDFIIVFDNLLKRARQEVLSDDLMQLTLSAQEAAKSLRLFKLAILKEHLTGKTEIKLPPTFFNHMLNELEEYLRILQQYLSSKPSEDNSLHYHLLWLKDGSGHAASIASNLDMTERMLMEKSMDFSKIFDNLYLKAVEYYGFMRTGLSRFPALDELDETAEKEMDLFKTLLKEIEAMVLGKKVLGTLGPLIPDHMFREECYYLTKLSMVSKTKAPDCDPSKPRIE